MSKRKPFFVCRNCNQVVNRDQYSPRADEYCSLKCAFWNRVHVSDVNSCWLWTGSKHQWGYGEFRYKKKLYRAHQVSYELHYGQQEGSVLHKCDIPSCCNPEHLYLGTQAENMRDVSVRNRVTSRKLTPAQVQEIRNELTNHVFQTELSRRFGITQATISAIATRKSWKHI